MGYYDDTETEKLNKGKSKIKKPIDTSNKDINIKYLLPVVGSLISLIVFILGLFIAYMYVRTFYR